jgi:glycolate oxidase FAD binding subunit
MPRQLSPDSFEAAASMVSGASAGGELVRIVGGASKLDWGAPSPEPDVELHTTRLDRIVEYDAGDLTAVLEAGVPLARAQEAFAQQGQMLALDPWLGAEQQATIGGVLATGDCGPLEHRYGSPRDLVLGMTVALSDGSIARSGSKVIKNVAGYDLAKLFCGAFGTLGVILLANVRLHPLPMRTATAVGTSADPERLAAAARTIASEPFELEALDVGWRGSRGRVLAQCGGAAPEERAGRIAAAMRSAGLEQPEVLSDDTELWAAQRAAQRSASAAVVRIAARPSRLGEVIEAVRSCGGSLVGRVALGTSFAALDPEAVSGLGQRLPDGAGSVLLDGPRGLRVSFDPWGAERDGAAQALMRRVKDRFDPAGSCNRGIFVGGI